MGNYTSLAGTAALSGDPFNMNSNNNNKRQQREEQTIGQKPKASALAGGRSTLVRQGKQLPRQKCQSPYDFGDTPSDTQGTSSIAGL